MNREEIIELAKKAALPLFEDDAIIGPLQRFAALVAAAEREACAVIAFNATTYIEAAKAIRARSTNV